MFITFTELGKFQQGTPAIVTTAISIIACVIICTCLLVCIRTNYYLLMFFCFVFEVKVRVILRQMTTLEMLYLSLIPPKRENS